MKKVPHKYECNVYSDRDLDCLLSPFERKYHAWCVFAVGNFNVMRSIKFNSRKDKFSELRKLVKVKHETILKGLEGLDALSVEYIYKQKGK